MAAIIMEVTSLFQSDESKNHLTSNAPFQVYRREIDINCLT